MIGILVPHGDHTDAANPAPIGPAVGAYAGFDVVWDNAQPGTGDQFKTVAVLISDPERLRAPGNQFFHRVGGAEVVETFAQCLGGSDAKLLIGDGIVDT